MSRKQQHRKIVPLPYDQILPISSFGQILGFKGSDYSESDRRRRWERWKELTLKDGDPGKDCVDYWCGDNVDETCEGCVHRRGYWCGLYGLPCNVNPILTINGPGIIGMACMGIGREMPPVQLALDF